MGGYKRPAGNSTSYSRNVRPRLGGYRTGGLYYPPKTIKSTSLRKEVKQLDMEVAAVSVNNATTGFGIINVTAKAKAGGVSADSALVRLPQGDKSDQRIGKLAFLRQISFDMKSRADAGSLITEPNITLRFIILKDKQCNGAAPTISDVFQDTTDFNSMLKVDNEARFKILWDKRVDHVCVAGLTIAGTGNQMPDKYFKKVLKFPGEGLQLHYAQGGDEGTTAELQDNNLYIIAVADGDANGELILLGKMRAYYTD